MSSRSASRADIDDFYAQKRLAIVGVSRNEKEYSRLVFQELRQAGYDVVPVNPQAQEIEGLRCYASVAEIAPAVDGAMVLLPAEAGASAAREAAGAGVKRLWLRYDTPAARELAGQQGVKLISGYCPFMFVPGSSFFHQCHAFGLKLVGKYPK